MSVHVYKSESYQPSVGMAHIDVETFESRDEGCKRYEALLKDAMENPATKWKFLYIEIEGFSHIERKTHVTSYGRGGYYCIGEYKLVDPTTYKHGEYY